MSIKILKPGLFSTIQDIGRIGYQDLGFSEAGALDYYSLSIAQKLIGNHGPAIEYTLVGPNIEFLTDNTFAIVGGNSEPKLNGNKIDLLTVYHVRNGDQLDIGQITEGARGYIVFGHPLKINKVAQSYSTHVRSGMGGFKGRALKKYDVIATQVNHNYKTNLGKTIDFSSIPDNNYIHVIEGPQINEFDEETIAKFVNSDFKISDQSDRMGYRLKGNTVAPKNSADIISEPVALGSIQVPNDGNPIILLNDKQTIGGYTKIATVTQLDLRKLAQMKPGDIIQFKWITVEEASKKLKEFNTKFEQLLKRFDEHPFFNLNHIRHTSNKIAEIIKEDR